jgi:hypothetical protein
LKMPSCEELLNQVAVTTREACMMQTETVGKEILQVL